MRALEEQYAVLGNPYTTISPGVIPRRFTNYDSDKMKRRSYYPHNQQLISSITQSSSGQPEPISRPQTPANNNSVELTHPTRPRPRDPQTVSLTVPPLPRTHMMPMEKDAAARYVLFSLMEPDWYLLSMAML